MGQAKAGHDTCVIAVGRLRLWPAGKPDRTTSRCAEPHASTPGTAGMEGAGETCHNADGQRQGQGGQHTATSRAGVEGAGGYGRASRRGAERSEAASPRGRPDQGGPLTATSLARLEADAGPAGPGRASRRHAEPHASTPSPTGAEGTGGTGGPGCGARGRWRGLAGQRVDAPSNVSD